MRWVTKWVIIAAIVISATPLAAQVPEQLPVETVKFNTEDGVRIVGSYYKPKQDQAPAVILLHMYRSDRYAWQPLIPTLHEQGFAVLAIDLRGHGASIQPLGKQLPQRVRQRDPQLFRQAYRDVMAAYGFLAGRKEVDLSRLAVVGASIGCSIAIDYAARDRSVDVVVCMTPGEDYLGVDSRADIKQFAKHGQRPILLLASQEERQASDALAKLCSSATVRIVGPGTVHGTHMFGQIKEIEQQIATFLAKHLMKGEDKEKPVVAAVDGDTFYLLHDPAVKQLDSAKRRLFSSADEAKHRGLKLAVEPSSKTP